MTTNRTNDATQNEEPQSAYNEETGEINWDCPCLGGMTKPPCGEYFKAAFSCFVKSEVEPKGSDCLEAFKAMQDCFSKHPEIYGTDDDEEDKDENDEKDDKVEETFNEENEVKSVK